jgi:hypothetical protein
VRGLLRLLERKIIRPAEKLSEKLRAMKHD